MAIKLTTAKRTCEHVKIMVFGDPGVGKTTLISTAPNPIIISAEAGLLSIAHTDIPVIEISTIDDLYEAYEYVISEECKEYETVCVDSASEIAEVMLHESKTSNKDGRAAYGALIDGMMPLLRSFRDIEDKHVFFTAKMARIEDSNTGVAKYKAMAPGKTLVQQIPYLFDELLCLRIGEEDDGTQFRYLQTQPSITHDAKDRSGKLDDPERPDLGYIFKKINGTLEADDSSE